jgi:hypothetical protein
MHENHDLPKEAVPMAHVDDNLTKIFPAARWLFDPAAPSDVVAVVSKALGPDWAVEREIDCDGEVSIVALPTMDDAPTPAFILYEKGGRTRVATIRDDEWKCDHGFNSFRQGVGALIAEAMAFSIGA